MVKVDFSRCHASEVDDRLDGVDMDAVTEVVSVGYDAVLVRVAEQCLNVTIVSCSGSVTDAGVVALAQGRPNLTAVSLNSCKQVTDAGMTALAEGCPNLTDVDLTYCTQVTDAGVVALSQGCPNLATVNLLSCNQVTDAGVIALAQGCPNLTEVKLSGFTQVTDAGVVALAEGCPNLTEVKLSGFTQVTDAGVVALAQECPNLTTVDLTDCTQVTDAGVVALAQECPNLTTVDLTNCTQVTDAGVAALAQGCPNLTTVDLSYCKKVTDVGAVALARGCPRLSSLDTRNSGATRHFTFPLTNEPDHRPIPRKTVDVLIGIAPSLGLHVALRDHTLSVEDLRRAVAQGADLSMLSRGGHTLLHSHALAPNPSAQLVAWLMGEGLDPFVLDDEDYFPYALAPKTAPHAFAVPLQDWIRANGDGAEEVVNGTNKATIALFVALRAAPTVTFSVPTLAFLINAGADINALEPFFGERPVHITASLGFPDLVMALLAAGADPWALNAYGEPPSTKARRVRHTPLAQDVMALIMGTVPVPAPFAAHVKDQIESGGGGLAGPSNAGGPSAVEALEARLSAKLDALATRLEATEAELAATKDELATTKAELHMTTIKADSAVDAYRKSEERIKDQLDAFRAHLSRRK